MADTSLPDSTSTTVATAPVRSEPVDATWQVGDWTFRPLLHRLSRDGRLVRLEPKVSDLLLFLADRRRQPVSKDAIFEGVWEQKFLGDSALTRTMAELRRALGDDARSPIYVETIPKLGYRLIADVQRLPDPSTDPPASPSAEPASGAYLRRFGPWIAATVLLLALASLVAVPTLRPTMDAAPDTLTSVEADDPGGTLVAVLPLTDLSRADLPLEPRTPPAEESQDFFAAGMTEALVTHLAQTGSVGVISRHSVDRLLAEDGPILDRARGLGIDALVEGTVQRAGERVRITVRLTELDRRTADRATYSWVESYERDLRDVLALQAEVALAIADEIRVALNPPTGGAAVDAVTVDPKAYELYLQARHELNRPTHNKAYGKFDRPADLFMQAIELDPGYAPAHAGLAHVYSQAANFGSSVHDVWEGELWEKALAAAERALELDERSTEAYVVRGMLELLYRWDWQAAERDLRRALELNPSDAFVHQRFAFFLTFLGRFDEAVREAERAVDLDPLGSQTYQALAHVYFHAGRYGEVHEVVDLAQNRLEIQDMQSQQGYDTWALAMEGRYDEAIDRLAPACTEENPMQTNLAIYAWVLAKAGRRDEAMELRGRLQEASWDDHFARAILETGLGDHDEAFAALERAFAERSPNVPYLKVEPFLRPLRGDPRFDQMVARLGL